MEPGGAKRKNSERLSGDHGYARVWANVTFEDLEQMDEDIQNSEIWAGSSVDVSNVEINRAGYSGAGSASQRIQNNAVDSSLLALCPMAFRFALEKTKSEWSKVSGDKCIDLLDGFLQLSDQCLTSKFEALFAAATCSIGVVRHESSVDRQKQFLAIELHRLQSHEFEWNLFDGVTRPNFTDAERRHTIVMAIEFLLAQLLTLATPADDTDVSLNSEPPDDHRTPTHHFLEEQAIYYVGGFLIRKLLKKFYTPVTPITSELKELLQTCIADQADEIPMASDWTAHVNRGGLVFITPYCHDLFMAIEKCAAKSGNECPDYQQALIDRDIDADVFRIAAFGDFSDAAQDYFKEIIVQEFYRLRGKAMAKKLLENAILSDRLLQERRGLRSKLQRIESDRMDGLRK